MREGFRLARTGGILSTGCRIFDVIDGQRGAGRGGYGGREERKDEEARNDHDYY
jgi:hypothetical protein